MYGIPSGTILQTIVPNMEKRREKRKMSLQKQAGGGDRRKNGKQIGDICGWKCVLMKKWVLDVCEGISIMNNFVTLVYKGKKWIKNM